LTALEARHGLRGEQRRSRFNIKPRGDVGDHVAGDAMLQVASAP
jgi:hypothetical protein